MTRTFSSDVFQFFKLIDDPVTIYGKEHKDIVFTGHICYKVFSFLFNCYSCFEIVPYKETAPK